MTLEELQSMSGRELDELAALSVMEWTEISKQQDGYVFRGDTEDAITFAPSEDMNDAMELAGQIDATFEIFRKGNEATVTFISENEENGYRYLSQTQDESTSRAITIAAILAKQEDKP